VSSLQEHLRGERQDKAAGGQDKVPPGRKRARLATFPRSSSITTAW